MRLEGKVAVITGGANGIGKATATIFAREGAHVVIADRDRQAGDACVDAITAGGGDALFVQTDVTSDADVEQLMKTAIERYGGIDILVNCAGVDIIGSVVDTEPERWHRVMDVNLASVYRACRAAIPAMIERGGGSIVNIASLQGMYGYPHYAAYAASKAAIIGMTRQVAVDYAADNIRVNSISPGAIETKLGENSRQLEPGFAGDPGAAPAPAQSSTGSQKRRKQLRDAGQPEDVGYAALFLASDESRHISGQNIVVDGGTSASVE